MCPLKKACLDYTQECDPFLEDAVDSKSLLVENKSGGGMQIFASIVRVYGRTENILYFTNFVLWRKNSPVVMPGTGHGLAKDEPGTRNHGGDHQVHLEVHFFSTIVFLEQQLSHQIRIHLKPLPY